MIKKELIKKYVIQKKLDIFILLLAFSIGVYFDWAIIEVLIFVLFIGIILKPIPGRILAVPALFCLSLTPVLLIFKKDVRAEEFAIYAYYFLVMAVIMEIYAIRKEERVKKI